MRLKSSVFVRWGTSGVRLGMRSEGWAETEDERRNVSAAWWERNKHLLPSCQEPGEPVPVLVDDRGVVVGILSPEAIGPDTRAPGQLRLVGRDP